MVSGNGVYSLQVLSYTALRMDTALFKIFLQKRYNILGITGYVHAVCILSTVLSDYGKTTWNFMQFQIEYTHMKTAKFSTYYTELAS